MIRTYQQRLPVKRVVGYIKRLEILHGAQVEFGNDVVFYIQYVEIDELRDIEFIDIYTLEVEIIDSQRIPIDFDYTVLAYLSGDNCAINLTGIDIEISRTDFILNRTEPEIYIHICVFDGPERNRKYVLRTHHIIALRMERHHRLLRLGTEWQ